MTSVASSTLSDQKTATQWPESLIKLVGTWADDDFPSLEEIRARSGEDVPREIEPASQSARTMS
jgi:hypothetical protein